MIRLFDDLASLMALAEREDAFTGDYGSTNLKWFANEKVEDTRRLAREGDLDAVPEAERLLDRLQRDIEVPRRVWERAPAGPLCVVPDVLAGLPTPFRRQVERGDERAPIAIIACSTISAGVTANQIKRRGTVILALVLALSRIRPLSLHTVATMHGVDDGETVLCTRIETAPLDLAHATWMLTSAGFARRVNHGIATKINGFNGEWPKGYRGPQGEKGYMDYLREQLSGRLGVEERKTLVIGPTHIHDPALNDPEGWLQRMIDYFTTEQEEASYA